MKKIFLALGMFFVGAIVSLGTVFAVNGLFPDVNPDAFYADGVTFVNMTGLMTGYEDGNFGPNDPVTRGQLATILKRYDDRLLEGGGGIYIGNIDTRTLICSGISIEDIATSATEAIAVYEMVCSTESMY